MVYTRHSVILIVFALCSLLMSEAAFAMVKRARPPVVTRKAPTKTVLAKTVLAKTVQKKSAPAKIVPAKVVPVQPQTPRSIFAQGELLRFSATFNQLDAGGGEIQLRQERQADGRDVFRFIGKARTSEWIDLLYKRRDNAEAIFGVSDYSPFSFLLLSREGDRRREYGVQYDPQTKTLVGSVKRKAHVREQSLPASNVYDPISALYLLRSREMAPGKSFETQIFTGKGHYRFVAQVRGQETIDVDGKKRPAFRLHPEVYSLEKDTHENILPQETTLWVSADPTHIPLKFESGTTWGWIVVELDKRSLARE